MKDCKDINQGNNLLDNISDNNNVPTKKRLVEVAIYNAMLPFRGFLDGKDTNLKPIIDLFPKWNVVDADRCWCAAFVYYCLIEAGFNIPYSPDECITCSLAGCGGFEEYALHDKRITYIKDRKEVDVGDIVLYDYLFCNKEHDHMGIVVKVEEDYITCAEGNIGDTNTSGVIRRKIDNSIRGYIRIPDGYSY